MKKTIFIMLLFLLIMSCTGCAEKNQDDTEILEISNTTSQQNVSVQKEPSFENDVNVTVQKTTFINEFEKAAPGCFFVIANIEMNNAENISYNLNPNKWALEWDGIMYSPDIPATYTDGINHPQTISDDELLLGPGEKANFQLVFQIQGALSSEPNPKYYICYLG